jgi:hypothetical protein
VFPFALCPCAGPDAPLGTIAWVPGSLRFVADGEVGASGSDGGVRVPLAAAMMTSGCCWRCARDVVGWNALRAAGVVVSLSPSPAFPPRSIGRGGPESSAGAYADPILLVGRADIILYKAGCVGGDVKWTCVGGSAARNLWNARPQRQETSQSATRKRYLARL